LMIERFVERLKIKFKEVLLSSRIWNTEKNNK
jgi:hypothetical protein